MNKSELNLYLCINKPIRQMEDGTLSVYFSPVNFFPSQIHIFSCAYYASFQKILSADILTDLQIDICSQNNKQVNQISQFDKKKMFRVKLMFIFSYPYFQM